MIFFWDGNTHTHTLTVERLHIREREKRDRGKKKEKNYILLFLRAKWEPKNFHSKICRHENKVFPGAIFFLADSMKRESNEPAKQEKKATKLMSKFDANFLHFVKNCAKK